MSQDLRLQSKTGKSAAPTTFLAGGHGMVGQALRQRLIETNDASVIAPTSAELNLCDQASVHSFFAQERPQTVILAAAKVGGIQDNLSHPVEFLQTNLMIQTNVIQAAFAHGAAQLIFLASSAVYPKNAAQPVQENSLLTGELDPANEFYAIAKIAGIRLCQAYRRQHGMRFTTVVPTNLYGPIAAKSSQVIGALVTRLHLAKVEGLNECVVWGTGNVLREFLHVRDFADALVQLLKTDEVPDLINIGSGQEISVRALAQVVSNIVGYKGQLVFDATRPEGVARKLLDSSKMRELGWRPNIGLEDGIREIYARYLLSQT